MNWKSRTRWSLLFALLTGVTFSLMYFGLEFTTRFHGFAVKALGPAIDLVWHHLDLNCYARSYCELEVLAANAVLYAFWVFIILACVDAVLQLRRRRTH